LAFVGNGFGDRAAQVQRVDLRKAALRRLQNLPANTRDLAEYTLVIEPLSLDEAYLDVSRELKGSRRQPRSPKNPRAGRAETSLTASAGISYNKFLAKLAPTSQARRSLRHHATIWARPRRGPTVNKFSWSRTGNDREKDVSEFIRPRLRAQTLPDLQRHFEIRGLLLFDRSRH